MEAATEEAGALDEELPHWLRGIRMPAYRDEVIDAAEENGAPEAVLEFLRALPAAVFASEAGLRHAVAAMTAQDLDDLEAELELGARPLSEDGEAG